MPEVLLKSDRAKLDLAARHVVLRKQLGCLVFLTCEQDVLEDEIIAGLRQRLGRTLPIERHPYGEGAALLGALPDLDAPVVHCFVGFPREGDDFKDGTWARKLAEGLNVERDLIPRRQLLCTFILPRYAEDTIALVAPDFYHFSDYSAHFHDDLVEPERGEGDTSNVQERIVFLRTLLGKSRDPVQSANINLDLAKANLSIHERRRAEEHLEKAVKLYRKLALEQSLASAYHEMAKNLSEQGNMRSALRYAGRYHDHVRRRGAPEEIFNAHGTSMTILSALGRYGEAIDHGTRALDLLNKSKRHLDSVHHELAIMIVLAYCHAAIGEADRAEVFFSKALHLISSESASSEHLEEFVFRYGLFLIESGEVDPASAMIKKLLRGKPTLAHKRVLFRVYVCRGEWTAAEQLLQKALERARNPFNIASLHKDIAALEIRREHWHEAGSRLEHALSVAKRIEADDLEKRLRAMLAMVSRGMGDVNAEKRHRDLLKQWGEGPVFEKAALHRSLGQHYFDDGRLDLAEKEAEFALKIEQTSRFLISEGETLVLISKIQGTRGQWRQAYETLNIARERVRDRDIPREAEVLELMGDAATQLGESRARGWYDRACTLYRHLEFPAAEALEKRLAGHSDLG